MVRDEKEQSGFRKTELTSCHAMYVCRVCTFLIKSTNLPFIHAMQTYLTRKPEEFFLFFMNEFST